MHTILQYFMLCQLDKRAKDGALHCIDVGDRIALHSKSDVQAGGHVAWRLMSLQVDQTPGNQANIDCVWEQAIGICTSPPANTLCSLHDCVQMVQSLVVLVARTLCITTGVQRHYLDPRHRPCKHPFSRPASCDLGWDSPWSSLSWSYTFPSCSRRLIATSFPPKLQGTTFK